MAIQVLLPVAARVGVLVSNPFSVPATAALCRTCSIGRADHDVLSPGHAFLRRTATFTLNIPSPDREDPTKTCWFGVQKQVGAIWKVEARIQWWGSTGSGNPFDPASVAAAPGVRLLGEEMANYDIRCGLDIAVSMQIGVQVEFL